MHFFNPIELPTRWTRRTPCLPSGHEDEGELSRVRGAHFEGHVRHEVGWEGGRGVSFKVKAGQVNKRKVGRMLAINKETDAVVILG